MNRSSCRGSGSSRWLAGAAVALLLLFAAGSTDALAASGDKQTEINARQAFAAGRYDEAIELFAKLYAETLNPIYLRNIGRCHQKKHEPDKAIDAFHDYLAKGKGITGSERKEIQGYIREMEQMRDDDAKRNAAVAAAAPVPPPAQQPPPGPPQTQPPPSTLSLGAPQPPPGDGNPMLITSGPPPRASHPFYTRWWFWTAVGVVAAGAVVTVLVVSGGGTTKPGCPNGVNCM